LAGGLSLAAVAASVSLSEGRAVLGQEPLTGCADRRGGELEIFLERQRCGRAERKLAWNKPGARGPAGALGARGAVGATGPSGGTGERGQRGDFGFDDFDGMGCDDGSPGTIDTSLDGDGFATFACEP
jgi:hypothetical protein